MKIDEVLSSSQKLKKGLFSKISNKIQIKLINVSFDFSDEKSFLQESDEKKEGI
jgi:hypothetical protein